MHVMDILTKLCVSIHKNLTTLQSLFPVQDGVSCIIQSKSCTISMEIENISRLISQFLSFDDKTNFEQICEQDIF